MEKMVFKILLIGTVITGLISATLVIFSKNPLDNDSSVIEQQAFNEALWDKYSGRLDRNSLRISMTEDLKQKLLNKPFSRQEVLTLLGPPEMDNSDRKLSYYLGRWSNNRRTNDTLDLYFDAQGKLERIEQGQQ